jgi:hypothetical protein
LLVEQLTPLQVQPAPDMDTRLNPAGNVSVTLANPGLMPVPVLDTVTVYNAPS